MEKIRDLFKNPLATGIAGLVIGLIIGLPILGWGLFPVQWKDADASYLRPDLKAQYFCMVSDSYQKTKDSTEAASRLTSMGINVVNFGSEISALQINTYCAHVPSNDDLTALQAALGSTGGAVLLPTTAANSSTSTLPTFATTPTAATGGTGGTSGILLGLLCVLFLAIGGVLIYIFFFRNRKPREQIPPTAEAHDYENPLEEPAYAPAYTQTPRAAAPTTAAAPAPAATDMPAAHFMTTFAIGDDLYDDSFSVDAANGEFLGECGVGISDTVGVGEPKKVSAFEVWLFDKNDIQTVTKVLMSAKAMNDPATRQRLASKGEPVLVEPGQQLLLETASLQLQAKVVEMTYGQGALPAGSYFERLTLELSVWAK